jgi:hypothetical protein
MRRIGTILVALIALTGGVAYLSFAPARADGTAAPVFDVNKLPAGYRDWKLISVAHEAGSLNDLRAVLGNGLAIKAYREGFRFRTERSLPGSPGSMSLPRRTTRFSAMSSRS